MELADPRTVAELFAEHARTQRGRPAGRRPGRRQPAPIRASAAPCPKVKRCHCGACCRCQEDARWERIFNERFADPDYYKERPVPCGSSMAWMS
jgi:hypothetical protein